MGLCLANGEIAEMKYGRCKDGGGTTYDDAVHQIIQTAHATAGDDRDTDSITALHVWQQRVIGKVTFNHSKGPIRDRPRSGALVRMTSLPS